MAAHHCACLLILTPCFGRNKRALSAPLARSISPIKKAILWPDDLPYDLSIRFSSIGSQPLELAADWIA